MDIEKLRKWIIPSRREVTPPIESGLYHYMEDSDEATVRFHLRVEPDGQGMLLANASAAIRLTASGVQIAKGVLDKKNDDAIVTGLQAQFKGASEETMRTDVARVHTIISHLIKPEDEYPVLNMNETNPSVFESQLFAPLEATVPLCNPEQMVPLLDKLWEIGIPHVSILVPESPDPAHLIRAVERAEDLGMIAGVRGRATDLTGGILIPELAQAGVDYVSLFVASGGEAIHEAYFGEGDWETAVSLLANIQQEDVYPMVEVALVNGGIDDLSSSLLTLINHGIGTFSFFAIVTSEETGGESNQGAIPAQAMLQTANFVEETADVANVRFIWQPPVERNPDISLAEQLRQGARSSGDVSVRIEPNGDVIPPRGPYRVAGNIFSQPWKEIWQDEAFTRYRERVTAPTRCVDCPGMVICQADCPRESTGWAGV